MRDSDRKEAFSLAYVRAVACAAGFVADRPPEPDRDSVDLIVRSVGPGGVANRRQIEMQVKSTATPILQSYSMLSFKRGTNPGNRSAAAPCSIYPVA